MSHYLFWDERYSEPGSAYGDEPNVWVKEQLSVLSPGKVLIPACGQGRDAIYAAQLGWKVLAFDQSEIGISQLELFAKQEQLSIIAKVENALQFKPAPEFDALLLIYFHLPPEQRPAMHHLMAGGLKPGGWLILEAFSPAQINYQSGGPQKLDWLFKLEDLKQDFPEFYFHFAEEQVVQLNEGKYHQGDASIVRILAQKKGFCNQKPFLT